MAECDMKDPVLVVNRHSHGVYFDGDRYLFPVSEVEPFLVTFDESGSSKVDRKVFRHVFTCDVQDPDEWESMCDRIIRDHSVRRIIAIHEKAIALAARLRDRFDLPGTRTTTASRCLDKLLMKDVAAEAGIPVPGYVRLDSAADLDRHVREHGSIVIKPRTGQGSMGVAVVNSTAAARDWWRQRDPAPGEYEAEEFVDGVLYHCDAAVQDGRVTFGAVSRYVAQPGHFGPGQMAGSCQISDGPLATRIRELNDRVVSALGLWTSVVHLEVFHTADDRLVFLEIAARPGGGGIDRYLWHACQFNIFEAAMRLEAGLDATPGVRGDQDSTWGVLGFYPGGEGGPIASSRFGELGIIEHLHRRPRNSGPVSPRHCTDYVDRYVVKADSEPDFVAKSERIREAYGAETPSQLRNREQREPEGDNRARIEG